MNDVIEIGSRRELLVDDQLLDSLDDGLRFALHQPQRRELVLRTDRPWEGNASCYLTVMQVGDTYRMYYKTVQFDLSHSDSQGERLHCPHSEYVACVVSSDGLHWHRPELGLVAFDGSTANNIVRIRAAEDIVSSHGFTPFVDHGPARGQSPFKAIGARQDLHGFQSVDGWDWQLLPGDPVQPRGDHCMFDSQNLAFWDGVRNEYRLYFRDFRIADTGTWRDIRTATSADLQNWSEPQWLRYPGAPDEALYTNQVQPYPRAPHLLIGFPSRYVERHWSPAIEALPEVAHRRQRSQVTERFGTALTDGLFMSSRDGLTFKRWGEAFIRPGPQLSGNWTYGDNFQGLGMIETPAELSGAPPELSFFATENYWRGAVGIRRFTLRLDGFVSLTAPLAGAEFTTKPLRVSGDTLEVNFSTSAAGSLQVELQNVDGHALPGFALDDCWPVIGDQVDRNVTWLGGVPPTEQPLRLRWRLADADLYAFRFCSS